MRCFYGIHEQACLDVTIHSVLPVGVALEDVARAYPAQAPKMAVRWLSDLMAPKRLGRACQVPAAGLKARTTCRRIPH